MNKPKYFVLLGLLTTLPISVLASTSATEGVRLVMGNDVWQPGEHFASGADWLALVCNSTACSFEPATLTVRAESWQGHYDEEATAGQKLKYSKTTSTRGKTLAWFRRDMKHAWLKLGGITTYASSAAPLNRPATQGTLEVAVDLPDGSQASLVPLLEQESGDTFHLQLRSQGRRQMLGIFGSCSHMVPTKYFLWAGDMDADGRPDYLISFVDVDGHVILYLSSAAKDNEVVGTGGVYDAPLSSGECDELLLQVIAI